MNDQSSREARNKVRGSGEAHRARTPNPIHPKALLRTVPHPGSISRIRLDNVVNKAPPTANAYTQGPPQDVASKACSRNLPGLLNPAMVVVIAVRYTNEGTKPHWATHSHWGTGDAILLDCLIGSKR